jgi:hypothetical protein
MTKTAQTMTEATVPTQVSQAINTAFNTAVANAMVKVPFHLNITTSESKRLQHIVAPVFQGALSQAQKTAIETNFFRAVGNTPMAGQVSQPLDWRYTPTSGKQAMDDTTRKIFSVLKKQQAAIEKLAQVLSPQRFEPAHPSKREAETIFNALPAGVRAMVQHLEVQLGAGGHGKEVKVQVKPGQNPNAVLQGAQATVKHLEQQNMLIPGATYTVQVVG